MLPFWYKRRLIRQHLHPLGAVSRHTRAVFAVAKRHFEVDPDGNAALYMQERGGADKAQIVCRDESRSVPDKELQQSRPNRQLALPPHIFTNLIRRKRRNRR